MYVLILNIELERYKSLTYLMVNPFWLWNFIQITSLSLTKTYAIKSLTFLLNKFLFLFLLYFRFYVFHFFLEKIFIFLILSKSYNFDIFITNRTSRQLEENIFNTDIEKNKGFKPIKNCTQILKYRFLQSRKWNIHICMFYM